MSEASPIQPQLLSRINETFVLRTIRQHGPSTRSDLSRHMGVTFPTIAKAVSSLLEARLLEEFEEAVTGPGRPPKRLRLSKDKSQVVGITIDVDSCEVAAAGFDGVLRDTSLLSFATPRDYDSLLAAIVDRVQALATEEMPILCIGVSVVGLVNYRRQEIRFAASLPYLGGKQLGQDLSHALGADCLLVHDTHALCLAEYVYGDASSFDTFAVLDLSTGIGLGVMVNGSYLTGHSGFTGEMGHIPVVIGGDKCHCGRRGCLETVASEWALVEHVSAATGRSVPIEEVLSLAANGDQFVRSELGHLNEYLAIAMANVVNLFNPQCIYISGQLFQELPWMRDQLVEQTQQLAIEPAFADCRFLPASGGDMLGAVAAAISAVMSSRVHELHGTLSGIPLGVAWHGVQ
ncbi:MAG: ROK family protein [Planctomycetes bacterium]|nr:ROK family protein [Planctomycetota bacterium]